MELLKTTSNPVNSVKYNSVLGEEILAGIL